MMDDDWWTICMKEIIGKNYDLDNNQIDVGNYVLINYIIRLRNKCGVLIYNFYIIWIEVFFACNNYVKVKD